MITDSTLNCSHINLPNKDVTKIQKEKLLKDFLTSTSQDDDKFMTFRIKSGKIEVEKTKNMWAGQCQSKVNL